jgi:ankyrin repeat protein
VKWTTLLLESGYDPLAITKASDKLQPLHIASENGQAAVANVLLKERTVNIDSKDGWRGRTGLASACQSGHENVTKLLLARDDIEVNAKTMEEEQRS